MCPDSTPVGRSKPPASLFYWQDFLGGTAMMDLEERGAYITLLCHAWDHEGIPTDERRLARILGVNKADFDRIWPIVKPKFEQRGDTFINPRMEKVRREQSEYRERQREAGIKGAEKRWGNGNPNGEAIGDPNGNPSSDPNGDPNGQTHGQTMALQSPTPAPTSVSNSVSVSPESRVFDFWKITFGLNGNAKLTPARRQKIQSRLKDSTEEEIRQAILGCRASEFHMTNGHTDLTLILRTRDKVEQFIDRAKVKSVGGPRRIHHDEPQSYREEQAHVSYNRF
jgi:uncharacterized protein YdaU (DUF1376 family)